MIIKLWEERKNIEVPFVASRVSARFEDGMLYVTLPKRNPDQD